MHTIRKLLYGLMTLAKWGILAGMLVLLYLATQTLNLGTGRDDSPPESQTPLFEERGAIR